MNNCNEYYPPRKMSSFFSCCFLRMSSQTSCAVSFASAWEMPSLAVPVKNRRNIVTKTNYKRQHIRMNVVNLNIKNNFMLKK